MRRIRSVVGIVAVVACVGAGPAEALTYRFDGPVVMVKDKRGYVGAIFRLNHNLNRRSDGAPAGLARLNHTINQRSLHKVSDRCYASILTAPPKWGVIGKTYSFSLEIPSHPTLQRRARLLRASTNYRINESSGLWRDPAVRKRIRC